MINLRTRAMGWLLPAAIFAATTAWSLGLEVRFYPQNTVRAHEVESRRGWSSVLLQNLAIVNNSAEILTLDRVELDLIADGEAIQTQRIFGKDLELAAKKGAGLQKAGLLDLLGFHFRPDVLLLGDIKLSPERQLAPKAALLITYRYFTFAGHPERIRVRILARNDTGKDVDGEGFISVSFFKSEVNYAFPVKGRAFIGTGQSLHQGHRWAVPEEFALDIARIGEGGLTYHRDSDRRTNYFAYGTEVQSVADGTVLAVQDSLPESDESLRRPSEGDEAYFQRVLKMQDEFFSKGPLMAAGNYVVIQHTAREFSFYAHLIPGSVKVAKGEKVQKSQFIGRLGHSGNSTEPHLHFQVSDGPDPLYSAGLPMHFENVQLPLADGPREIQSGDIVQTR